MGCRDSTIMSYFPSLKADDAIRSAPQSSAYNCISWAGGRTDLGRYFWPPETGNPWRGSTDLESFDNFFGNMKDGLSLIRYNGAMNYTRSGANAGNAVVALWAAGSYTHASVKRPGNAYPHGYDWESKPGGLMRTFHPRDALEGDSYGQIVAYYRWDGTYAHGSAPMGAEETGESDRMAEIDRAEVVESDREKLYELLSLIPEEVTQEFEQTYQAWKATWDDPKLQIHSNPRMFAQSEKYERFRSYCQEKGKTVWPLVFSKYEEGEELVTNLIEDLTLDEYAHLMDEILDENLERAKDVIPSQKANWTRYVIHVTSQLYEEYEGEKP
jgi:hypothetical protein